jgi:hypothetical protein
LRAFIVTFSSQMFCPSSAPVKSAGAISPPADALISLPSQTCAEQFPSIK